MKIQLVHMNDSHSQLHETITRVYVWNRQLKISVFFSYGRLFGLLLEWKTPMNTLKVNFKVQSNWSWTIRNNACRRALQVRTWESFHSSWLMNYRSHAFMSERAHSLSTQFCIMCRSHIPSAPLLWGVLFPSDNSCIIQLDRHQGSHHWKSFAFLFFPLFFLLLNVGFCKASR